MTAAAILDRLAALRCGDLAGARELRLPDLAEFPREVFGLSDTLEVLDLSGGTLAELPDDIARLRKLRVLFCSGNRFERLPPALGDCAALSQVGFRGTGLREVPAEALPPRLRWLTLTDNWIAELPDALGERPLLQKLMLSGNRLKAIPQNLAAAPNLELIRLAANLFDEVPAWIATNPSLAWISLAGNPFDQGTIPGSAKLIPWRDLDLRERLGEGASGLVHRALWRSDGSERPVAVKLFKCAMTSDGLPEREMAACLAAGPHPSLTGAIGRVIDHPLGIEGLVMPLLPAEWRVLAGPPSLESCSRDVYAPDLRFPPATALRIACDVASAAAHLHARGLLHGDLYAHNILWDGTKGAAVLSDFGAASSLPTGEAGESLKRLDVRAFGLLLGELLDRCDVESDALREVERACLLRDPGARPPMVEVADSLGRMQAG
ncbi:leucine-rich repeat-containing protein kinase family protein [Methylobacterium sp.]|uniref:leucine-rich repeat-containing protein kinase family protein n=1 Tax=Methylobacterium sp. TaxID=409 RepID=UPI0025D9999C|nr:leucine-rich repeat-containing protein kinase family protein [Methylobacterium sp.]